MGFLSDVFSGVSNLFTGGGEDAARTAQKLTGKAEQRAFARFEELRALSQGDFESTLGRIQALQNPALAQLVGLQREFEAVPQQAIARQASSASALSRQSGGPRTGQTFGLARAALSRQQGAQTGLDAALLRLQGLQGRAGLTQIGAQLSEADLARQANVFGQERSIQGTLANTLLAGQTGIASAGIGQTGQILSTGISASLSANVARGIGNLIGGGGG